MTKEWLERAQYLRGRGWSYRAISEELGGSVTVVARHLNPEIRRKHNLAVELRRKKLLADPKVKAKWLAERRARYLRICDRMREDPEFAAQWKAKRKAEHAKYNAKRPTRSVFMSNMSGSSDARG